MMSQNRTDSVGMMLHLVVSCCAPQVVATCGMLCTPDAAVKSWQVCCMHSQHQQL